MEEETILKMVAEGALKPEEAARLLSAMKQPIPEAAPHPTPQPEAAPKPAPAAKAEEPKERAATMEVQMQRPDGTFYTVQVPTGLIPAVMKIAGVSIKESIKQNSTEAWDGFKQMVKRKTDEVKVNVKDRVTGNYRKAEEAVAEVETIDVAFTPAQPKADRSAERQLILKMVQNGRLTAEDASRLIAQME